MQRRMYQKRQMAMTMFIVLGYALTIKLRKSPFDISACHHAHQEVVRGVYTEYSGPYLALIEIAHWYEVILVLGFCALFWATSVTGMGNCGRSSSAIRAGPAAPRAHIAPLMPEA